MPLWVLAIQRRASSGSTSSPTIGSGAAFDVQVRPPSSLTSICACPNSAPTIVSPDVSIAWKSAFPSCDTDVHVLPASSDRISPSAEGSDSPSAGCPEPSRTSGSTKRVTSASESSPVPDGVSSVPVKRFGVVAPGAIRNIPVLVVITSVPSAGLTVRPPTIGGSPSGSTHSTASACEAASLELFPSPPQPASSAAASAMRASRCTGSGSYGQHPHHDARDADELVHAHPLVDRMRALDPRRARHHAGDAAGGEQPHVGAVGDADDSGGPASLVADRALDELRPRMVRRRLAGQEGAAGPVDLGGRLAVVERAGDDGLELCAGGGGVGADRHAEPALGLHAVGHLAGPLAAADAADEHRVRQLQ